MFDEREKPPPLGDDGFSEMSSVGRLDNSESAPKNDQAQEIILQAIKALSAEEICENTFENVPLMLATSGWRSTAALLTHAAGCADAGDFLSAERNRQRAREQFIEANDAFRKFMEARAAHARAEAYQ